jgi:hypothetical protein
MRLSAALAALSLAVLLAFSQAAAAQDDPARSGSVPSSFPDESPQHILRGASPADPSAMAAPGESAQAEPAARGAESPADPAREAAPAEDVSAEPGARGAAPGDGAQAEPAARGAESPADPAREAASGEAASRGAAGPEDVEDPGYTITPAPGRPRR